MDFSNPLTLFLSILAGLLILVLLFLLLRFLVRPSAGRDSFRLDIPLRFTGRRNKKHHVFLGLSRHSKMMASQILQEWKKEKKKKDQGGIIVVDLSDSFHPEAEEKLQKELGSSRVKLISGVPPRSDDSPLASAIGLEGLQVWFSNPRTSLYLFSESKDENARLLFLSADDASIKAKVFYYASEPGGFDDLIAVLGSRVRVANPHFMSFMYMKQNGLHLPVNFVQKAVDASGKPLGYVQEGLHALVIGFGHTGQEAVRFLYEYGSFVGKDLRRAPMSIAVYDSSMERHLGDFLQSAPALKGDEALQWKSERAGTAKFWEAFEADARLNYIVVAVDEGPENIRLGVELLKSAARSGRDLSRMTILVRNWSGSKKTREVIDFANATYCPEGVSVLYAFGLMEEIWNPDILSGRTLKKVARHYLEMNGGESWEQRRERLSKPGPDFTRSQMELRRRQSEDLSRALYASTLASLAPEGEADEKAMPYLSAQEHLHWMNALAVDGYTCGPADELLKRHPEMVPYPEINGREIQDRIRENVKGMLSMKKH